MRVKRNGKDANLMDWLCDSLSTSDHGPVPLIDVSHFISRGLFRNYKKDAAARRAATSMFWFKENQRPPDSAVCNKRAVRYRSY